MVFTTVNTTEGTLRAKRDACGMGVVKLSAVIDPDSGWRKIKLSVKF